MPYELQVIGGADRVLYINRYPKGTEVPHFTLSRHLQEQAVRKGWTVAMVRDILENPGCTYDSFSRDNNGVKQPVICRKCKQQQKKWTGETKDSDGNVVKLCVTVFTCCGLATTVWADQQETELRPDQKAQGRKGYIGKDGLWRRG